MAEVAIIPKKKIARMQQNLSTIRKIAGWTTEELAYKMDVTKQTICNLESGRTPMSFAQYFCFGQYWIAKLKRMKFCVRFFHYYSKARRMTTTK